MDYPTEPTCQIPKISDIYNEHFGYKTNGIFVEVGAFDGQTHSNTSFLADLGWKGLYIEPVIDHVKLCKARHANNDVKVLPVAVGADNKTVDIGIAGELSTVIKNPEEMYKKVGLSDLYDQENKHAKDTVLQLTLNDILRYSKVEPFFDLLVIDTESTEFEVLMGFNLDFYKPKMVIIEMHETSPEWMAVDSVNKTNQFINLYFDGRYKKVFSDPINTIFVR